MKQLLNLWWCVLYQILWIFLNWWFCVLFNIHFDILFSIDWRYSILFFLNICFATIPLNAYFLAILHWYRWLFLCSRVWGRINIHNFIFDIFILAFLHSLVIHHWVRWCHFSMLCKCNNWILIRLMSLLRYILSAHYSLILWYITSNIIRTLLNL
jgi:hypothetical protein